MSVTLLLSDVKDVMEEDHPTGFILIEAQLYPVMGLMNLCVLK